MPKTGTVHDTTSSKRTLKTISASNAEVTSTWPCKINGCNKQFAREADLKRHQRTTKLHSMPSFSCPQCDAAFTRTDALRRHQKSRHNGIIIEPPDRDSKDEDHSYGTASDRGDTPSAKGRTCASKPELSSQQPRGPSNYYRSHTLITTPNTYMQRPSITNTYNPPSGLLTPATRFNMLPWGYPIAWHNGIFPHLGYQHIYYSPYYRYNGMITHLPSPLAGSNQNPEKQSPATNIETPSIDIVQSDNSTISNKPTSSSVDREPEPTEDDITEFTEEQVLEITQAAVKAVLEAHAQGSEVAHYDVSISSPAALDLDTEDRQTLPEKKLDEVSGTLDIDSLHEYCLGRADELERLLTENDDSTLGQAELLTQESLASPLFS